MGDIDENTPPIFVLLPTCDETNTDVFFEILKSVVLHSRLHDNIHINCMISAMLGETFQVDMDDLSVDWNKLTTNSRQIRQSKLLGFWAARHYPLIGKKLIGAAWQPPKECNVQVSEPTAITKEEIYKIVSKKMKLRIIELNVCKGTSKKLNYFVRAPMSIGKNNVTILSSKMGGMRAFEIESEYLEECWNALKLGGFTYDFEQQMDSTASFKARQSSIVTSHLTIDSHQVVRRNFDQSTAGKRNFESTRLSDAFSSSSRVSVMPPCNILLTDISAGGAKNNIASELKTIPSAKRPRCLTSNSSETVIMHEETNIDELRLAICELRKDIVNLTKCNAASNAAENENESQQFHIVVFKQKDSEIAKLRESIQRFEKECEVSKDERTKLSSEIEAKSNLITALQKVVDCNSKLHGKMEEESNAMVRKLSAADQTIIELTDTQAKLQQESDAAKIELKKVSDSNSELHGMMQVESDATVRKLADLDSHYQHQIQDIHNKLYAQAIIELTDTQAKLQQESDAAKIELKKVSDSNSELHGMMQVESDATVRKLADLDSHYQHQIQDIHNKLYAQAIIELTDTQAKLQQESDAAKIELKKVSDSNSELHGMMQVESDATVRKLADLDSHYQHQIQDLHNKLYAADQTIIELADLDSHYQHQIQDIHNKLYAQAIIELTDTQAKLQQESDAAKIELKKVSDSNSELHGMMQVESDATVRKLADLDSHYQHQIQDIHNKLYAQAIIELTDTQAKLQQESDAAKIELKKVSDSNSELHGMMQVESDATVRKLADLDSHYQHQIQDLHNKLYAADQTIIELTDTQAKLQQESDAAKIELKKNEKLSETLHNLKARTDILIKEFQARVEGTEEMNAQLADENEKLQEELKIFKQNTGEDKELLLLPDRPETNIETKRKVKPVHDGYDQTEFKGENIQCIGLVGDNLEEILPETIARTWNEGLGIEPYGELQPDRYSNGIYPEPDFVSEDPIVVECRPVLQRQKFGWMKFHLTKNAKFFPAFVYQMDEDGLERAQKIKTSGCITDTKSPFWEFKFAWELPDDKKQSAEVSALKKFNMRFGANFE